MKTIILSLLPVLALLLSSCAVYPPPYNSAAVYDETYADVATPVYSGTAYTPAYTGTTVYASRNYYSSYPYYSGSYGYYGGSYGSYGGGGRCCSHYPRCNHNRHDHDNNHYDDHDDDHGNHGNGNHGTQANPPNNRPIKLQKPAPILDRYQPNSASPPQQPSRPVQPQPVKPQPRQPSQPVPSKPVKPMLTNVNRPAPSAPPTNTLSTQIKAKATQTSDNRQKVEEKFRQAGRGR